MSPLLFPFASGVQFSKWQHISFTYRCFCCLNIIMLKCKLKFGKYMALHHVYITLSEQSSAESILLQRKLTNHHWDVYPVDKFSGKFRLNQLNSSSFGLYTVADPGFPAGGRGPRRGAWTLEAVMFRKFCISKWKNLDPWGACAGHAPSRSANGIFWIIKLRQLKYQTLLMDTVSSPDERRRVQKHTTDWYLATAVVTNNMINHLQ